MPNGIFLGSPDSEFTRRVMLDHYEQNPDEMKYTSSSFHNFYIDIIKENKTPNDITDEEVKEYWPYIEGFMVPTQEALIAIAHCETCNKIKTVRRYCPTCPYRKEQFILKNKEDLTNVVLFDN